MPLVKKKEIEKALQVVQWESKNPLTNQNRKEMKMMKNNDILTTKKFKRHFRKYIKSGHPAYILDQEGNMYVFHRVTFATKSGHHTNWKIDPNPDKTKKTPMYIVKQEQKDNQKHFSKKELPYNADLDFIKRAKKK